MTVNPEHLLNKFIATHCELIPKDSVKWMNEFIDHGECGIAYDLIVFHIQEGSLIVDPAGGDLIQEIAKAMNLTYPQLSTERVVESNPANPLETDN
jgi:hypothetical protein